MKYLLDTNICIYLLKQRPSQVARRFAKCYEGEVVISAVTLAELRYGVRCCPPETRTQNEVALNALLEVIPVIPFDEQSANRYAEVRYATSEKKSDTLDKLIAAQAIALDVVLVTNNEADFRRYPGVKIENWTKDQ